MIQTPPAINFREADETLSLLTGQLCLPDNIKRAGYSVHVDVRIKQFFISGERISAENRLEACSVAPRN